MAPSSQFLFFFVHIHKIYKKKGEKQKWLTWINQNF